MTDGELTFGALDFLADPFHAVRAGFDTGKPEPLVTAIPRLMFDGELVTHERDSNREITFQVEVTGDDVLALNEAEADLVREVNKPRNELRWKPPGMNTPVTVFDTFAGYVTQVFDDYREMTQGKRVYTVTIPAEPHARSESLSVASLAGRTALATLDSCDSLTNWGPGSTGWVTPTLDTAVKFAGTGSLKATGTRHYSGGGLGGGDGIGWKRTASFAAAAGTHVVAVMRGSAQLSLAALTYTTSVVGPPLSASLVGAVALAGGWVEYTWALGNEDAVTVTSLRFEAVVSIPSVYGTYTVTAWLDNVRTFSEAPPVDKGGLRLLETGGSMRTPGTLRLSNASTALGSTLVATWPDLGDGYRPDCARWYKNGGTQSSDASSVSGSTFTSDATFRVPNTTLEPGPYAVFVAGVSSAGTVTVRLQTDMSITNTPSFVGPESVISGNVATVDTITPLGIVHLPATTTPGASVGSTSVNVSLPPPSDTTFDEVWLVRIDDAQVTWLDGLTTKRIWLESPSVDLPYGGVWVGDAADESDAHHPGAALKMLGRHIFTAPTAAVYVASMGAAPSLDLLYYKRHHSNATD